MYGLNRGLCDIIIIGCDNMSSFDQILYETRFSTKETVERMRTRYSEQELATMLYSQNVERERLINKYQNSSLSDMELMKVELTSYMTKIIEMIKEEYGDLIPEDRLDKLNCMLSADSVIIINVEQDKHDFSADSTNGKVIVNIAKIGKSKSNNVDIYTQMAVANGILPHELFHIIIQMLKPEELADERMIINLSNGETITSRGMVGFMLNEGFVEKFSSEFCEKYGLYHLIALQYLPYVDICNFIMETCPNINKNTIFSLDESEVISSLTPEEQQKYYQAEAISYAVRHKERKATEVIDYSIKKIDIDFSQISSERFEELKKYYLFKNNKLQETLTLSSNNKVL